MALPRASYFLPRISEAIELRAFTHGLMPKTVPAMMQHFVSDWQTYGVDAWNKIPNHWCPESGDDVGWWTLPSYLGDQFIAPLLGATAGTCVMQPNVHWIVQSLLSSKELFATKRKVILTEAEFPSVRFSLTQWAEMFNLEILTLPLHNEAVPQAALLEAIDEDTALVIVSHVGFTTGERLTDDFIQEIAKRVHEVNGLLAIDGYHSIGAMTASVADLEVDVYFGGLLKEGSGSSGNAYLYIRPGLELTPRLTGWFGDADPFGFKESPDKHTEVRQRFLGGTTAIASLYHAVEGIRLLSAPGLSSVRADSLEKTAYCIELADEASVKVRSPREAEQRSVMVVLEMERADLMCQYLKQHHIYTDSRQSRYLRMAPFVWNTMEEIERTFRILSKGLQNNLYLQTNITTQAGPVT